MIKLTQNQKWYIINKLYWEVEQPDTATLLLENDGIIVMPWEVEKTSCDESFPYSLGIKCKKEYYELECITLEFLKEIMTEGKL